MKTASLTPARAAMGLGVALAWVSAFMPWLEAEALDQSYVLRPALDEYVGPAVWIELVALTAGLVIALRRGNVGIVGPAAAVWFNLSVSFWLAGYRVASYVPSDALPDDAALGLGTGASLGTGAAILLVAATLLMLVNSTWKVRALPRAAWSVPVAAIACVLVLVAREAPWFEIHTAQGFDWSMGFDVIPFFGDLLGFFVLTGSIGVVLTALFPRRWLILSNTAVGLIVVAMSLIAFAASGLVEVGTTWAVEQASFLGYVDPEVTATNGPAYVAGGGVLIVVASLLAWPRRRRSADRSDDSIENSVENRGETQLAATAVGTPALDADPFAGGDSRPSPKASRPATAGPFDTASGDAALDGTGPFEATDPPDVPSDDSTVDEQRGGYELPF